MKTLLIWDQVPEESDIYVIEDPPEWLDKCHGLYINGGEMSKEQDALMHRLNDALCETIEYCGNSDDELATKWSGLKADKDNPLIFEGPIKVVRAGFVM